MENPHFVVLLLTFQNQWDGQNDQELMHSQHKSALSCFFLLAKKEVRVIYYLFLDLFWRNGLFFGGMDPFLEKWISFWTKLCFLLAKKEVRSTVSLQFLEKTDLFLKKQIYFSSNYRKVASSNTSRLEAHAGFFRLLMKGIFDPYVLWPSAHGDTPPP